MENQTTYRKSKQRQRILAVLNSTRSHPTAAWLYDRLKPEFPSLSLGTVYRNLRILEEQEL
ncbi:MAG: transcriptional repressor [Candidatus Marinimicrobia bacterium]|nr:transcriptional repressor [Candidatus Neomarinimicrobiota bacterium]